MEKIKDFLGGILALGGGVLGFGIYILIAIGGLYWLWMAIQIGSFGMFVVGLIPPFFILTAPIGAYSFIFGVPDWIFNIFG